MAVGAYLAAKELNREKGILFVGVDGLGGPAGGIKKVQDRVLAATFYYPLAVDKAMEIGGRILRESGVPTVELRASIILGSGSLSFEMIRSIVERLPVLLTPRWVSRLAQPVAVEDALAYLAAAPDALLPDEPLPDAPVMSSTGASVVVEIGGPDRV